VRVAWHAVGSAGTQHSWPRGKNGSLLVIVVMLRS
jgi:hypothetical protein